MSFLKWFYDGLDKQKAESDRVQAERAKADDAAEQPTTDDGRLTEADIAAELAIVNNRLYHIEKRLGIRTRPLDPQ